LILEPSVHEAAISSDEAPWGVTANRLEAREGGDDGRIRKFGARQDEGEGAPVLAGESPADEEPELTVELLPRRKRRRHVGAERGATRRTRARRR